MKFWRSSRFWIFAILAFALAVRAFFFIGEGFTDDDDYIMTAKSIAAGVPLSLHFLGSDSVNAVRIMTEIPIALCFKIFGFNVVSADLYIIFSSLACIYLTYLISKKFFGESVALWAAFLYAIFPVDLFYATQVVADIPVAFLLLLGLYALIQEKFWLAGISWGIGLATKENGIFFIPVLFAYLIHEKHEGWWESWKEPLKKVALGFGSVAFLELWLNYVITGNPFHRLHIYHQAEITAETRTELTTYPLYFVHLFTNKNFNDDMLLGLFPIVLLPLFLIGYRHASPEQKKKLLFLALWFLLVAGYLEFGVMTLGLRPMAKWIRYWTVVIAPMVILSAHGLQALPHKARWGLCAVILFQALWVEHQWARFTRYTTNEFREDYRILNGLARKPIYGHYQCVGRLDVISRGKWEFYVYHKNIKESQLSDSYAIIMPVVFQDPETRSDLPDYILHVPKRWKLIALVNPPDGYHRNQDDLERIYYVPPSRKQLLKNTP